MLAAVQGKGLKTNALSFLSNLAIGVSSAAPAYSLASALGAIAAIAAFGTPAVMIAAFIPMLFIAMAYYHLNRAAPDCGTSFTWCARTMGPHMGWIAGWALIATNIIVMPGQAAIAGQYSFQLFGETEPPALYVTLAGVAWIAVLTAICYIGIELSARTQQLLLGIELAILLVFAGLALAKAYGSNPPAGSAHVSLSWFNPSTAGNLDSFTGAFLVAVFIYWGWDTGLSVNEETKDPGIAPGRAAVASTFLLLALYVLLAVAAVALAGPALLSQNKADVFASIGEPVLGFWAGKLLVAAVLTSAAAATQTTIVPAARTALSMAAAGAIPARFGAIHPRYLSPGFATLALGAVSIVWYVGLTLLSKNVLDDSILAIGLPITFYYALTGFACVIFYRGDLLKSGKDFIFKGLFPGAGALMMALLFFKSSLTLASTGSIAIFGIGAPTAIGVGSLAAGIPLMMLAKAKAPGFFMSKRQ